MQLKKKKLSSELLESKAKHCYFYLSRCIPPLSRKASKKEGRDKEVKSDDHVYFNMSKIMFMLL